MCLAAMEDFPEVIKLLAECGADVCTSTNGIPPVHFSGSQCLESCLLALVNAAAAIEQVSEDGMTALVCSVDNISAVRIFLDNDADVNFRNKSCCGSRQVGNCPRTGRKRSRRKYQG
jgi:hypothetical protein